MLRWWKREVGGFTRFVDSIHPALHAALGALLLISAGEHSEKGEFWMFVFRVVGAACYLHLSIRSAVARAELRRRLRGE